MSEVTSTRTQVKLKTYADENECVAALLNAQQFEPELRAKIHGEAVDLVQRSRSAKDQRGMLDAFLEEFGLSNSEGIALMCLAEALLRIPDGKTADEFIAEKVRAGDWGSHLGQSDSTFVNASVWGMMLTGKVVNLGGEITRQTKNWFGGIVNRLGEPVIRTAMLQAMKIMGKQYVLGRTIEEAMKRGPTENPKGTTFSFDMLGEAARTEADAQRYWQSYFDAIKAITKRGVAQSSINADSVSIKLSALHSHYRQTKKAAVMAELMPRVKALALEAKQGNIGFNIDAEEAERLDISLDIFEALARDPELKGWQGLGFVLQAYQKRAPYVANWLIALARDTQQTFMVRLVKGAYWDSEIKHAQELGLADYPVFTRKANTDLSYMVCARILLAATDAIYPQFATHNAQTIASIMALAQANQAYEFQRLHGMGDLLYSQLMAQCQDKKIAPPQLRVYAPVGAHQDLLPYLVRRLLENGANSSFVNRFLNDATPAEKLVEDVVDKVSHSEPKRHPRIPAPADLFLQADIPRINARGVNLEDAASTEALIQTLQQTENTHYHAGSIINGEAQAQQTEALFSPAKLALQIGSVSNAEAKLIDTAMASAAAAQPAWDNLGGEKRAQLLEAVASALDAKGSELMALISREAGRTLNDALSELREAIDFCRYYAALARQHFAKPLLLPGPTGESNSLSLHGRGVFLCISPWNFPLAIFVGQVVAALAAGNSVVAKPAEQTPLIAFEAVKLMHAAGIPPEVLQLVCGIGREVGPQLVAHPAVAGIAFTGSTETAKSINAQLAAREGAIVPLIAETGGLNAMIADSSALPEQLVDDIVASAFLSAGQRCSALRVLYLQEDIADKVIQMLSGACEELALGEPWHLATDMGPVIDKRAQQTLQTHIEKMTAEAKLIYAHAPEKTPNAGTYIGPHIFEIENIGVLEREVFGPILHIIRYRNSQLETVIQQINGCGYGLTLGVHSRIESRASYIFSRTKVGNTYVNRNMVGAVVGVNPFGGQGLSGTGPKAGGPRYLFRFATEKTYTVNTTATGGNVDLFQLVGEE